MDHKASRNKYLFALAICAVTFAHSQGFQTVIRTHQRIQAGPVNPRLSTYIGSTYFAVDSAASIGPNLYFVTYPTDDPDCQSGDLLVVVVSHRGTGITITNTQTGGQTWNALANIDQNSVSMRIFWAKFNGTWNGIDPQFTTGSSTNPALAEMHVFRPADGASHNWAVDVAQSSGGFSAPSTPFDVTVSGITTVSDTTVVIAVCATNDDNSWALQTAAWDPEERSCGSCTISGSDCSVFTNYLFKYPYGATGNVVMRQTNRGGDAGAYAIVAFK